jgi:hypothetical protein
MTERHRIARWNDIATRHFIYESEQAIEVDEHDHFEIVRRRVFFDDILLVTYHKELGGGYIATMATLFVLFAAMAVSTHTLMPMMIIFAALAGVTLICGILRLTLLVDVITVFGRRSKAAMRFSFRKAYARDVFERICAKTAAAQQVTDAVPPPEQ